MDKELEEKLNKIGEGIEEIKTDVGINRKSIEGVKSDVKEIKIDVGVNKTNILVGFKEVKEEQVAIKAGIDKTYNAVDGFIKIVTKLEDEFTIMKEDIKRVKEAIKEKLGVDLF